MRAGISLEHVALTAQGRTLKLRIDAGQRVVILGPTRAGKSDLLSIALGKDRPARGKVELQGETYQAIPDGLPRRLRPIQVTRTRGTSRPTEIATRWFVGLGLWESRQKLASELTNGERAALEILAALASEAQIIGLDTQLDRLDPWTRATTIGLLDARQREGTAIIIVTNDPAIIHTADSIVLLRNREIAFAGGAADLVRLGPRHSLTVTTENQPGVRNVVAPFEVALESVPEGIRMSTPAGQAVAAQLLQQGYGDVKLVLDLPPTIEDALLRI